MGCDAPVDAAGDRWLSGTYVHTFVGPLFFLKAVESLRKVGGGGGGEGKKGEPNKVARKTGEQDWRVRMGVWAGGY